MPGKFQPRQRRPDLHEQRARRHVSDERAEGRDRQRLLGRAQQRRHGALLELSVRRRVSARAGRRGSRRTRSRSIPAAAAFTFTTPPQSASVFSQLSAYALNFSMDTDAPKIFATSGVVYASRRWSFMTPPDETNLSALKQRGAKLMVYHGTSDPVFSSNDTTDWYQRLTAANGGDASNFARLYTIAGMNHCTGGPSTDQFDMLTPMIAWVEQGKAPDSVVATARDASNVGAERGRARRLGRGTHAAAVPVSESRALSGRRRERGEQFRV